MRVVVFALRDLLLALFHELAVVQIAQVGRHAVVAAQVFGGGHLFAAEQGLVQLLAVAGADHVDLVLRLFHDRQHGLDQGLDGGGRRLLDEHVAVAAVFECVQDQVDGVFQGHHEAGHFRIGHGDRLARADLVDEQRNHRTARGHHVAVAGAANDGLAVVQAARLGDHDLFHHRLGNTHGVDRIGGLVGAQADDAAHAVLDRGFQQVVGADHVGLDRFHRVELTGGNLLERRRVEDIVDAAGRVQDAREVAHVADVELQLRIVVLLAHVVLLLLVTAENADLRDAGVEEALQHCVAERTGATSNQKHFAFKHNYSCVFLIRYCQIRFACASARATISSRWATLG